MKKIIVIGLLIAFTINLFSQTREWKRAERKNTIESYQAFLKDNSTSEYADLARLLLDWLYDERDWQLAVEANEIKLYEEFLKNHGNSKYAYEAKVNIAKLTLPSKVKQRIEAGEVEPPRVNDPGGQICNCKFSAAVDINSLLSNGLIVWTNPFGGETIICVNYGLGKAVLTWRHWYCLGEDKNCVLSRWINGAPTFEEYGFKGTATYNFGNGIMIQLEGVDLED